MAGGYASQHPLPSRSSRSASAYSLASNDAKPVAIVFLQVREKICILQSVSCGHNSNINNNKSLY